MDNLFFIGGIPWWALLAVALATLALVLYQYRRLRERLSARQSLFLTSLRGVVYALLIFFLLNPGLVEERIRTLRRPVMVLIDTSQSMEFPAHLGQGQSGERAKSRLDLVKERLLEGKEPQIEKLARDYDLRLFQFNTALEAIGATSLPKLAAGGKGTRMLEALREAGSSSAAGIILFSDGIANGEDLGDGPLSLSTPVFAVGVGETEGYTDIRLTDLTVPEFAFRGRELKVDFTVRAYGFGGKKVPLHFNRGRSLISTRTLTVDGDPFEEKVTLTYTPKEVGPHSFTLTIPPQMGEQITHNNHKEFRVEVKRDKIRVLTLSGSPAWNYRFLRMALKQDPFIDLVSFVFLRTPIDSVDVPESQLSLIPFPIDEIFLEELKNFDVVLFDDFSHRSYFNVLYLEKLRDFVKAGGGFAMIGGIRSFDSGGYSESPLREVLPVELDGKGNYQTGVRLHSLLTPAGRSHPITRLLADPGANEEAWKKMIPLTTVNRVAPGGGEVLLLAAPEGAGGGDPLVAVGRFGKGRTIALMSDDLWRWNFIAVGEKQSPQGHLKFIRQMMRWLAQEPSFEQVEILSLATPGGPGQKGEVRIRVLNDDYTPAPNASVRLQVVGPDGERTPLEVAPGTEQGEYRAEFTPAREGSYRVEAEAQLSGQLLGRNQRSFFVAFPHGETEEGRPRPELLKRIARESYGEFIPIGQWDDKALEQVRQKMGQHAPSEVVERRQVRLWSNLWIFSLLLALLGAEWWLRRSWGLV